MHGRLHPVDAQTYWMSAKIPNDQFLLFCFESDSSAETAREDLLRNARRVVDLGLRIVDAPFTLAFPGWSTMPVTEDHVVAQRSGTRWSTCLDEVAGLFSAQLDQHETTWKLHVFARVAGAPRCDGHALVVVLQISHALGDGRIASAIARGVFSGIPPLPAEVADRGRFRLRELIRRSSRAQQLDRELVADTAAGSVPPQAPGRTKVLVNTAPTGPVSIRAVVRNRTDVSAPGISVTAGALTVVSVALTRYLHTRGASVPEDMGAEVTFAKTGNRRARNHFRNAGVGLHPAIDDPVLRARSITADLVDRRARAAHPAMEAQSLATEMVPAILLRWGIRQFDETAVPPTVTGNTVVSSVARGEADMTFGGGPVRFTSGFPALSPVMALTHGVHGIGDTVTIGITSAESAVPDPDLYASLLDDAADDVARAFGRVGRHD